MTPKRAIAKQQAYNEQIVMTKGRGFNIMSIQADAGDGFGSALEAIGGPRFDPIPPGRKDGLVEATIIRVIETMRSSLHAIKYK